MELSYRKLLLSTMHMVTCSEGDPSGITDGTLMQAMTVNENLHALGFTLRPQDIGKLAASDSMEGFYRSVQELVPEVKANPMYPDFPIQVMEMDEAQFRFHQLMHYFSTYGQMVLTGMPVSKGWLPDVTSTPKTEKDDRLLEDTALELVTEEESYPICLQRLLSRRERLTLPEKELVLLALPHVSKEALGGIRILFKENLELLFPAVFEKIPGKEAVPILRKLCQHTGDVLNNIHLLLKKRRYHFRTSEKRMLVRLLESYPASDFRGNLILSNTRRERNLLVLRHLDYSAYSRSAAHKKAVGDLRRGQLHSWEGRAKKMLLSHEQGALAFTAERPGLMLRMLQWILSLGYDEEEIAEGLCAHASEFSTQMLVKLLSSARVESREKILAEKEEAVSKIRSGYDQKRWPYTHLRYSHAWDLKVEDSRYEHNHERLKKELAQKLYDLSERSLSRKCQEETAARKNAITEELGSLHERQKEKLLALEKSLAEMERRILFLERTVRAWKNGPEGTGLQAENAAHLLRRLKSDRDRLQKRKAALKSEIDTAIERTLSLQNWEEEEAQIRRKYEVLLANSSEQSEAVRTEYERRQKDLVTRHKENLAKIEKDFAQKMAEVPKILQELKEQEAVEVNAVSEMYDRRLRALASIPARKRILAKILKTHLAAVSTPLRGRKIYLDPGRFDLAHSLMKTTDKSQDSTYIRSGFAWKIPDEVKRVRFFVYWNDKTQVDLDLHASAAEYTKNPDKLKWFHVGWNGSYKQSGVIHSGDITYSDAAEYIDIDLSAPIRYVTMNIDLYWGRNSFQDIDECFTGLMAVRKFKQKVRLYDPANCFFTHELCQDIRFMNYGYIDVRERYVRFIGDPRERWFSSWIEQDPADTFYVSEYLDILLESQGAAAVDDPAQADVILTVDKSTDPGAISLVDHNFFLDADTQNKEL